jgi:hypothetical protein
MARKLVLIIAVITFPSAGFAGITAASSVASATPPPPAVVCQLSGNITFPAPGLSADGVLTTASTSAGSIAATLSPGSFCPGANSHMPAQTLTLPNVACTGNGAPSPVCTSATGYVSDSANGYVATGATFWMALPNHTRFHIANVMYKSTSASSTVIAPGGACGALNSGFKVNGALTVPSANSGDHTHLTLCLNTDTGPGTTGNFTNDLSTELASGAPPGLTITTAGFDPSTSKLKIA